MKNRKGFTLLEILSAIIILGVILTFAVLSISRHINGSKKDIYVITAQTYIRSATNMVNTGKIKAHNQGATYYIPEKCIPIEKERRSPNGKFKEAYVVFTFDKKEGHTYYWMSRDSINEGFYLTKESLLDAKLISHTMKELVPNIGIKNKNKILILNDECNLDNVDSVSAEIAMNGDNLTEDDIKNPIVIPSNPNNNQNPPVANNLPILGTSDVVWNGIDKLKIESIKIENHKNVPSNAIKNWDASEEQNGSVMAWYLDSDGNGKYEVYIGGENKVYANRNSSSLFRSFENVKTIDLSNLDTSEVRDMSFMFGYCNSLSSLNIINFDTSEVRNMFFMFYNCSSLTSLDLSSFNTSKVTNMKGMFSVCKNLVSLNISSFNTSKVNDMSYMFVDCIKLKNLNLSNFNTSEVTNMSYMFFDCYSISSLNLSNFDTSKVQNMSSMFGRCYALNSLNLNNFDTSKVTNIDHMFIDCINLMTLDISSFDTSKATNMRGMFQQCSKLTSLNLSNFNTSNVVDMSLMFASCKALTLLNISSFDTSKVKDMSYMFFSCNNLTSLNLSNFNTSQVTNMSNMFHFCTRLSLLDIRSFVINDQTTVVYIFQDINAGINIKVKDNDIKQRLSSLYPALNITLS